MRFGEIYLFKKYAPERKLSGHYFVVLNADQTNNAIYYQVLSSRMYKVFRNFGSWKNVGCMNCSDASSDFQMWKTRKINDNFLDVDTVTFLNYKKYPNLLRKETYLCLQKIKKDNLFDFQQKVSNGAYPFKGRLNVNNNKGVIISMKASMNVSPVEAIEMLDFYNATK